jgi:CYTH domain-containing protein
MDEIEKKYLIREGITEYFTEAFVLNYSSIDFLAREVFEKVKKISQGYLEIDKGLHLAKEILKMNIDFEPKEARLRDKASRFYFTLKGEGNLSRSELEQEITSGLFNEYWPETKGKRLEKFRLKKPYQRYEAEFDIYTDRNLIIAEVEVPTIADVKMLIPLGKDVTDDKKYKNKNLAK